MLRGPFPQIAFMPTGGVSAENFGQWLAAEAYAVGAGDGLCPPAAIESHDWAEIQRRAEHFVAVVREVTTTGGHA